MNSEQSRLEARTARYAALADPVRLRIVDLLTLGDVAPSELQHELGVSSNLLAHHLGVLEQAALIERHRSEADRRRSYIHLADDAFTDMIPTAAIAARRVVFVCTGNSARSQLAAALWDRSSDVPAVSAGTHPAPAIEPGAIAAAHRHGLALRARRPRALDDVLEIDDLIVTVCDTAHEEMRGRGRLHWSIPDPVHDGSDAAFDAAFEAIAARITELAPRLTLA